MSPADLYEMRLVGLVILTCTFGPMALGLLYCSWRLITGRD